MVFHFSFMLSLEWTGLCFPTPPSNSYVEPQTLSVTIFGYKAYKKVIKFKRSHTNWGLDPIGLVNLQERHQRASAQQESDHLKARKRLLSGN